MKTAFKFVFFVFFGRVIAAQVHAAAILLGGHGDLYLCHVGYPYQEPQHRTGL